MFTLNLIVDLLQVKSTTSLYSSVPSKIFFFSSPFLPSVRLIIFHYHTFFPSVALENAHSFIIPFGVS